MLNSLDQVFLRHSGSAHAFTADLDCLMMVRVGHEFFAKQLFEQRAGYGLHGVNLGSTGIDICVNGKGSVIVLHMLIKGSAHGNVDHLMTSADAEDGLFLLIEGFEKTKFHLIDFKIALQAHPVFFPVTGRIHVVAAAGQKKTIRDIRIIYGIGCGGNNGNAASFNDGAAIIGAYLVHFADTKLGNVHIGFVGDQNDRFHWLFSFVIYKIITGDRILEREKGNFDLAVLDIHAEATSEKWALADYFSDRVQVIFGTHTHVQTADEQILPTGCAYITDVGMCGPIRSALGVKTEIIVARMRTAIHERFELSDNPVRYHGILVTTNGFDKVTEIKRVVFA